ncbi:MAG: four helix bundle protein [Patescibacteria group bacterium]
MELNNLEIYKLAVEIAEECWPIYSEFDWQTKKLMGDQWMRAVDSMGANISEANGRYHFLDRNRFYYVARGSLKESVHWTNTLYKREKLTEMRYNSIFGKLKNLDVKLNNAITSTYKTKQDEGQRNRL